MAVISGGRVIEGSTGPYLFAGTPGAGTSEVITATVQGTPDAGTYRLKKDGVRSGLIAFDAAAAAVQSALQAIPTIGSGGVQVTGSAGGPYTITASGDLATGSLGNLSLAENNLGGGTDPTVEIVETTPGVDATARGAAAGAMLISTTTKKAYINTGTPSSPVWTVIGAQS